MATRKPRGRPACDEVLTLAEWRAVHAVRHGLTNRGIAARRSIRTDAVKFHVANVCSKLGVRSCKSLRQWFCVPRGSALSERANRVETTAKVGRIAQISRTVKDVGKSDAWYRDGLGLPLLHSFSQLAFFDCGGT